MNLLNFAPFQPYFFFRIYEIAFVEHLISISFDTNLLIKEKNMSIARINMLEFDTEDDLEQRANVYKNEAPKLFPNAEILLTIRTGPTSAMSVSVYPNDQAAEVALVKRDKHFKSAEIQPREAWYLEGKVVQRHIK